MNRKISHFGMLFLACLFSMSVFSGESENVTKYKFDCLDCLDTRESVKQALVGKIETTEAFNRIFYIMVPSQKASSTKKQSTHKQRNMNATEQSTSLKQYVFVIKADKTSEEADYIGISGLPCPRCKDIN
jgi:hypothetical protein